MSIVLARFMRLRLLLLNLLRGFENSSAGGGAAKLYVGGRGLYKGTRFASSLIGFCVNVGAVTVGGDLRRWGTLLGNSGALSCACESNLLAIAAMPLLASDERRVGD